MWCIFKAAVPLFYLADLSGVVNSFRLPAVADCLKREFLTRGEQADFQASKFLTGLELDTESFQGQSKDSGFFLSFFFCGGFLKNTLQLSSGSR